MTLTVELVYDKDCPHVAATRANLLRAFEEAGVPAKWTEWEQSSPATPARLRAFGSPTVLVEGHDVAGAQPVEGLACCRLYETEDGRGGVPPVGLIVGALSHAKERTVPNLGAASGGGGPASP
jgi:mercuric ion transport protein